VFAPFFLLRRARRTWRRRWLSGFIADGQRWCGAFRLNGTSGIEKGKRGRRAGDQLILTELKRGASSAGSAISCQTDAIALRVVDGASGAELIHKKLGKTLGLSTMQLYLKRGVSLRKSH